MSRQGRGYCEAKQRYCPMLLGVRQTFYNNPEISARATEINEIAADVLEGQIEGAQERCEGRHCGIAITAAGLLFRDSAILVAYEEVIGNLQLDSETDADLGS